MLLLLLLVLLCYIVTSLCTLIAREPSHLPNPNTNPTTCHSIVSSTNNIISSVCDVDHVLLHDSKYFIDNYISSINRNSINIYVAIVSKIDHNYTKLYNNDINKAAKNFAITLYKQWSNGSSGIIIFASTTDEIVSIYTSDIINDDVISIIVNKMMTYVKLYDYGKAFEVAIIYIDAIISTKSIYINTNTSTISTISTISTTYWILLCIIIIVIVYWYSCRSSSSNNDQVKHT